MATKADKTKWDKLRADLAKADAAYDAFDREPLSVVVPRSYGHPDGYMKENTMSKKDAKEFREFLEKAVILVAGEEHDNSSIDLSDPHPVRVGIIFNVSGFGPHVGAICAGQGSHADALLEVADELLEEWERDKYGDDISTETYDGRSWEMSPEEFSDAIQGTRADQFFEIFDPNDDNDDDSEEYEGDE